MTFLEVLIAMCVFRGSWKHNVKIVPELRDKHHVENQNTD